MLASCRSMTTLPFLLLPFTDPLLQNHLMGPTHVAAGSASLPIVEEQGPSTLPLDSGLALPADRRPASLLSLPQNEKAAPPLVQQPVGWKRTLKDIFDQSPDAQRARAGRPDPWFSRKFAVGCVESPT